MSLDIETAFAACPVIAILRGLEPERAVAVGEALVASGIRILEVPLNSPEPLVSIGALSRALDGRAVVGAGTVTDVAEVEAVADAGGRIIVSPNIDIAVVAAARARGLPSFPGVFTASEAFLAWKAGATALKLFPADLLGTGGIKALKAVLPKAVRLIAVGGVDAKTIPTFHASGCAGYGVGSSLFVPGLPTEEIARRARDLVQAAAAV